MSNFHHFQQFIFFHQVWVIKQEGIHCIQVYDFKEIVYGLVADADFAYFFTQGAEVKVKSLKINSLLTS